MKNGSVLPSPRREGRVTTMQQAITTNTLFYGDNLPILREHIPDESVDLIYLDPPFNSNRSYNVLFKVESGTRGPRGGELPLRGLRALRLQARHRV